MHNLEWDPLGHALYDYYKGDGDGYFLIHSSIEPDRWGRATDFLHEDGFNPIEKAALNACRGKVLDIGAGAGSHSLALVEKGLDVVSIDISPVNAQLMLDRGLPDVRVGAFEEMRQERFDTLLLMMNGIGFTGTLEGLGTFLSDAKSFLKPGGQLVLDSTDIAYVGNWSREAASLKYTPPAGYYGETLYQITYKDKKGKPYPWLYLGRTKLESFAKEAGYVTTLLSGARDDHYLLRLQPKA